MKYLKKGLKTLTTVVLMWMASNAAAYAQDMHMAARSGMPSQSRNPNVFLIMMDNMMGKMDKVPRGQPAAKAFIDQMIPHHQGAIEMANYEILHGKNFEMIQLAKSIKAEQQSELQQMNILRRQLRIGEPAPSNFGEDMDKSMEKMMMNLPDEKLLKDTDHAFARVMLPHHQAAVDMARALLKYPVNIQIDAFAKQLISNEQVEIEQMSAYLKK